MTNLRVHEFAARIGKSVSTVRRWDREGRLPAQRTPSGERYYTQADIQKALGIQPKQRKIIVYCRVSSNSQKTDLESQVKAMEQFCLGRGLAVDEWVEEIGSGLNFKRKKFLELMTKIEEGEVSQLIIAHKDRLSRFGFDYFEYYAQQHNCEIVIANQKSLSPEQEMVEDLLTIIHCFSSRLYGLRKYKKVIKTDLECHENN